jgi:uncharacterized RDD family membrane protein YckC
MSTETEMGKERVYAGFWVRLIATLVDDVIVMVASTALAFLGLGIVYLVLRPAGSFGEAFSGGFIQAVNIAAMVCVSIPYYIGFHWRFGWTPGKRLFSIRVVRADSPDPWSSAGGLSFGVSATRYFSQALSALPFGAGYLMVVFNPKKRALHDYIAGTVSVIDR